MEFFKYTPDEAWREGNFDYELKRFFGTQVLEYLPEEGDEPDEFWKLRGKITWEGKAFWEVEEPTGNGTYYHGLRKGTLDGVTYVLELVIDPPFGGSVENIWRKI